MDGWWDCEDIAGFIHHLLGARLGEKIVNPLFIFMHPFLMQQLLLLLRRNLKATISNRQNKERSNQVAKEHYDLGNDLYQVMLDINMAYSCAYWKDVHTIDEAQEAKFDLVAKKIELKFGMRVLELGCGWGGFMRYVSGKYGVSGVGMNLPEAKGQIEFATAINKDFPVKIVAKDYREARGIYDSTVSIGILEHVGYKNYRTYFEIAHRCLSDDPYALSLVHCIGRSGKVSNLGDPWLEKYIFKEGMLPSRERIKRAINGLFVIEDWHVFEPFHYAHTLSAWWERFEKGWQKNKNEIRVKYENLMDGKFYRMWKYYLLCCKGVFLSGDAELWQIVLSKGGYPKIYMPVR